MFLINWIDKRYDSIKNDPLFEKYFKGSEMEEIEGTYYMLNAAEGIDIVLSDAFLVQSIHLFSGNSENREYKGEMPTGLRFSMSQDIIKAILGDPKKTGGGYTDIFGPVPKWDKYFFEGYSLHIQYSEGMNSIDLITIASLSLEAYFNIGLQ